MEFILTAYTAVIQMKWTDYTSPSKVFTRNIKINTKSYINE